MRRTDSTNENKMKASLFIGVILLLLIGAGVWAIKSTGHRPVGKYVYHLGTVSTSQGDMDVPDRFVEFVSGIKCKARLNVLSDVGEYYLRREGNKILLHNGGKVFQRFIYDSKFDELLATEGSNRWLFFAEKPQTKAGQNKQRCLLCLGAIKLLKQKLLAENKPLTDDNIEKAYKQLGLPGCPDGGQYVFNGEGQDPTCTVKGHRLETNLPRSIGAIQ